MPAPSADTAHTQVRPAAAATDSGVRSQDPKGSATLRALQAVKLMLVHMEACGQQIGEAYAGVYICTTPGSDMHWHLVTKQLDTAVTPPTTPGQDAADALRCIVQHTLWK
jgi:hypothetical protein